ncbi:LuxR C-terminal-related transcriptional regulator [Virgisporangium aurantiacum]|uniref:LuxR family transcriptional regulator n=1 Tax=Virgisporangium aurantiacum TaxID=175570 RepID=A0A8J3ZAJ2_9ACTN|nr:LuxR C-terminal-related transcriptional regulator [Virgisporangium aurantiacum]GIJ59328.1 LuxR family transcriptional regulator [Virgisporangium aurantiacum]
MGRIPSVAGGLLLATKLFVPRPRADLVPRPRLITRLNAGLAAGRCSLLSAPAGAGKTSLLAAWLAQLDRPAAWLTLDDRDQTADQVLRYLVAACQVFAPACGRKASAWLEAQPPPRAEVVVTELVNDLAALPSPGVLVLDDYHVVRDPAVHAAVVFLLDHLPPSLHLVIAGREDPPLPLPQLRARRHLVEVRAPDLSFSVAEAAALLAGLCLPAAQVTVLVERTEGWAAGLQLAGLALHDRPDPAAVVSAFTGGHRLVADYLLAEVLERQPPATRRFLLATSVLDRLCAPLCDTLVETALVETADSQEILEGLERANLFLVPLDDERVWYRFHRLFADASRARLVREAGPEAVAALHRRAGAWFGRHELLPEAIGHALAGGAAEDAVPWIEALTPTMFATMSVHRRLADWLAALPDPVVRSRPLLCLARAWLLIHRVELQPATAWIEAAEAALTPDDAAASALTPDDVAARGAVAATRAYLATVAPDAAPEQAVTWAEQALADLPPAETAYRSIAGVSLGQAALALGRLDGAERAFAGAATANRAAGLAQGDLTATTQQVSVLRLRGARREALATGQAALAQARDQVVPSIVGRLQTALADALLDANDLDAALPLAMDGLAAPREFGNAPPLVLLASLPVVRLRLAEGDPAGAEAVLAEVRPLVRHGPYAMVAHLLAAAEARIRLATDDGAGAVDWAAAVAWDGPVGPAALADLLRFGPAAVEATGVTPARVLLARGRATGDADLLDRAQRHLDAAGRLADECGLGWLRPRVAMLRALLADARGDSRGALGSLTAAVAEAEREGVVRPFLDEGEPMAALLADLRGARPAGHRTALAEPLTERELEVLRLLAAGHSNAGIATALFVELSTVKTHLIHLYGKLGVHSRTRAVARARALGLLN